MRSLTTGLLVLFGLSLSLVSPAADFSGNGKDDLAIFRSTNGLWAVRGVTRFYFGSLGDIPVPGDYFGGSAAEGAIFRPGTGLWAIRGVTRIYHGTGDDVPLSEAGGGQWTPNGSDIYYNRGNVGIGTTSPGIELHLFDPLAQTVGVLMGNGLTGAGSQDGFKISYRSTGRAEVWNFENTDMTFATNNTIRMRIRNNGKVGIGTSTPNTKLAVYGLTGTSSYNYVKVDTSNGDFYYASSSERYKKDIRNLGCDFHRILEAEPKSYVDKASGQMEIGYLAEDFDGMGLKELVIYDSEGRPDGLKYEKITLYLVELVKEQKKQISALEEKIVENEGRVNYLSQNLNKEKK